jgi:E3 ubiquitin-protein ligase HECTD2
MCCDSNLRFPTSVTCYRCTVCVCVNDLKPNQPRQGFQPVPMTLELLETLIPSNSADSPASYEQLEDHLIKTFSTFESLNESFPNEKDTSIQDPGVDLEAVRTFYQRLKDLPCSQSIFLSLIKTSEVLLRRPGRPLKRKEDLRFLLIILENPALAVNFFTSAPPPPPVTSSIDQSPSKLPSSSPEKSFDAGKRSSLSVPSPTKHTARSRENSSSSNPEAQHTQHSLMKRMYGIMSNLPNELHHYLVNWFARLLTPPVFRRRVEMINSFIAYRLGKHQKRALLSGPSGASKAQRQLYTNDWQIKASARMMALFFAANSNRPKIELSEFYNTLVRPLSPK